MSRNLMSASAQQPIDVYENLLECRLNLCIYAETTSTQTSHNFTNKLCKGSNRN